MLIIGNRQIKSLEEILVKKFKIDATVFLSQKYPESPHFKTDESISNFIDKGVGKASEYKILENRYVMIYLEYMLCLGIDFDKDVGYEVLQKILHIRNLSGREKVERMLKKQPIESLYLYHA